MRHREKKVTTLGILGGGQLGMLLALAAKARLCHVHLYLEKEEHAPATPFADKVFIGEGWNDTKTISEFARTCDVILLENEFVPVKILSEVATQTGVKFLPELKAYGIFQNKAREKELATKASIGIAPWMRIKNLNDVRIFQESFGKIVLKTCEGGYDGYGNLVVTKETVDKDIQKFMKQGETLAEAFIKYSYEIAVVVATDGKKVVHFPVAETIQSQQICHYVLAPARLSETILDKVKTAATQLVQAAGGVGLFGIEFFITPKGDVLYNETAPRPHNSAHFTIDGCNVSQFDMLIHLALGEELPEPQLVSPVVGMLNLLGTRHGTPVLEPAEEFQALSEGKVCLYGKPWSRPGRKMGHFNLRGTNSSEVLAQLTELQQRYQI